VRQVKETTLNPVYVFIAPPSMSALRARLLGRGTESDATIERRLSFAVKEIDYAKKTGGYDCIIVNDNLDRAYGILRKIALGETTVGDELPELNDG
jgi:guanylate kinase